MYKGYIPFSWGGHLWDFTILVWLFSDRYRQREKGKDITGSRLLSVRWGSGLNLGLVQDKAGVLPRWALFCQPRNTYNSIFKVLLLGMEYMYIISVVQDTFCMYEVLVPSSEPPFHPKYLSYVQWIGLMGGF